MLTGMRAFAKSKWAIVLLALLALALGVGVGISNPMAGVTGGGFVQAGEHSFGTRDANRYLNQYIENVGLETGETVTTQQAAETGVTNQIVGVLQQRAAALALADKVGVKASPTAVAKIFAEAPRFRDALGMIQMSQIDDFAYNEAFRNRAEFEDFQRDEVTIGYLEQASLAGLNTPDILVNPLASWLGERRLISYAQLRASALPELSEPTDEELRAFYDERAAMFEQPERRAISGIIYSPMDFVDLEPITDEMVASAYEVRIRSYTTGERREIVELTAVSAADVQVAVDLVKQGVSVEDAVSQVDGVSSVSREVGTADITDEDYSQLVFGLPEGEIAGPFEIEGAPIAVVVRGVVAGDVRPLEEVAEDLRMELAEQDARRAFNTSSEDFYDLVGAGLSLEEIASELDLPMFTLSPVDRSGGAETLGPSVLFSNVPEALPQLFQLLPGDVSDVFEEQDLRAVFRLDGIVEPRTLAYEEVEEDLAPLFQSVQLTEQIETIMEDAVARINSGEDLDVVARDVGMDVAHPETPADRPLDPSRANPLVATAFDLDEGQAGIVRDRQAGQLIVRVREVLPITPDVLPAATAQVETLLDDSMQADVQQTFGHALTSAVKVRVNENAVASYLNSFLEEQP